MSVRFLPHFSHFTYDSQMETAKRILDPSTGRWRPIILNQLHLKLSPVDLVTVNAVAQSPANAGVKEGDCLETQRESDRTTEDATLMHL